MKIGRWALVLVFLSCSTANAGSFLASVIPSVNDWKASVIYAIKDPVTWVPLGGALIITALNADKEISNWAVDKRPVFGDHDYSDTLRDGLEIVAIGTLVFSPQQKEEEQIWPVEKGLRLAEMYGAALLSDGVTGNLKRLVRRRRPSDPYGMESYGFPSGHATLAFAWAASARRNLEDYDMPDTVRYVCNVGIYTAAAGVAWDRVELKAHYPTDVLVGAAVGNFVATTIYRAFTGVSKANNLSVNVSSVPHGAVFNLAWNY